ncbi:UPF0505 protein C16orf62 [Histomonas meleagridis]|uniref:UPF0505 protein C16orf62-like n=1 Tax=Histomonas meleagridis TaxID=135588 RepID=UPI00355A400C|nr:UPF0505 protein C16orf62 [Histomonas meleagridis]KAH0805599.1 UPF0505 protein C16orf62-like [Histomonas meleagridis]
MSKETYHLIPLNKDPDVLLGYQRITPKPSPVEILGQQVSVEEAFDIESTKNSDPFTDSIQSDRSSMSMQSRWSKFKNYCLGAFQTRASDFMKENENYHLLSKRVRDRLAELAVTSDEAQQLALMQQNEERLRNEIKKQSAMLSTLYKESKHLEMIELISKTCRLLMNTRSPQFYPAQFMLVLELVEHFGNIVYDRISSHESAKGNFLESKEGCRELLCLNWSMILCRTDRLLPRLLLEIAFLRSTKFHPFRTTKESIQNIIGAIPGLGSGSSGIYVRAYLVYTLYTYFPETSCDILLPLFTSYATFLLHFKNRGFSRQFNIIDYSFSKYIETHRPALEFFVSVMVSVGDINFLKEALNEFYSVGIPSSFILSVLLDELPPKFVAKIYNVLLMLIDKSDDVIPKPTLLYKLINSLNNTVISDNVIELMNDIWNRMGAFVNIEDFIYVASPLTKFIAKFCQPHYLNYFLKNVVTLLRKNIQSRKSELNENNNGVGKLSDKLSNNVSECIIYAVKSGKNFAEVLQHINSIVDLMDFLNERSLVEISRFILNDVSVKQFELNDPLCVRILLELSQILYQSLNILSPVDVIEKTNQVIEWFLFHVDFGNNIEAHLNFLLSARSSFPSSDRILSTISRISFRLATLVYSRKRGNYDVITRSLLSFAFVTIPTITNVIERSKLLLLGSNVSLTCNVICFAHSFYNEFVNTIEDIQPSKDLFELYIKALNLVLIMPSPIDNNNPYEHIKKLIIQAIRKEWNDSEPVDLALESIILMAHSLRSEYNLKINGVDSNDVLFAGNDSDFKKNGQVFIDQMLPRFLSAIQRYGDKGVIAMKTKVPIIALHALAAFPDVFEWDKKGELLRFLKKLANLATKGDNKQIKELKESTAKHLHFVFANVEEAQDFLSVFDSA